MSEVFQEILDIQEVRVYRVKGGEGVLMVKMVCQVFPVETVNEARLDHLVHLDSQVLRVVQGLLDPLAHLDQLESVEKGVTSASPEQQDRLGALGHSGPLVKPE